MTQSVGIVDWFKWLYENGMLAFTQMLLVFAGLIFTGYQLRLARRSFQATVVGQVSDRSSQLQWDVIKDQDLQTLLGVPSASGTETAAAVAKRELVSGLILNHFAHIFDLWQLGGMTTQVWRTFEADLIVLLSRPGFAERWSALKRFHDPMFVAVVDRLLSQNVESVRREKNRAQQ